MRQRRLTSRLALGFLLLGVLVFSCTQHLSPLRPSALVDFPLPGNQPVTATHLLGRGGPLRGSPRRFSAVGAVLLCPLVPSGSRRGLPWNPRLAALAATPSSRSSMGGFLPASLTLKSGVRRELQALLGRILRLMSLRRRCSSPECPEGMGLTARAGEK
ncbi:hypothetical protein NDU88_009497 [Pleurodeles waltl]|uniref:Uncharacterized protein n=1 Tax=Pleurodeles waltl TaxID=8319 RepID=A0AAV7PVC4_PLEWA|nr:hypothetical protein NDU88_009497 [Pleurodeles waltl]